jgi:hypothetical protein
MSYAFNRFRANSAVKASLGNILTDDQLRAAALMRIGSEDGGGRGARFAPVATIDVLNGLRREGFDPVYAGQARTRDQSRREFTKHMVRLRHRGEAGQTFMVGGSHFEIVLINANDGTSAYHMLPGVFRLVCLNGLMVGDTYDEVKVRHTGDAVGEVIEGAYRVLGEAPRVAGQVDTFRALSLNRDEQQVFAEAAHMLRFPDHHTAESEARRETAITAGQLLRPRRADDRAADLWTTFNVTQENVIRGGLSNWGRDANNRRRRQTMREVNGIDQNRGLNRALWTLTERMAELKGAA